MRWTLIGLLLLGVCCNPTKESDPGTDPGVRYSLDESNGTRIELNLFWDMRRAVVGSGTKQSVVTNVYDEIAEARISELRALFTEELLAVYQANAATDSGVAAGATAEWRVGVNTDRLSPAHVFAFQGTPTDPRTVQMLETLDTFTRSFLPE